MENINDINIKVAILREILNKTMQVIKSIITSALIMTLPRMSMLLATSFMVSEIHSKIYSQLFHKVQKTQKF